MITKNTDSKINNIVMVDIDSLVPRNHLVRKINRTIDFNFIYELVEDLYSEDTGRPSIDPVILFKILFIQYLFNIRSMRQTIAEIEVNNAYRWFLGFDFNSKVPHFSTFGKNYKRRFEGTSIFRDIFERILSQIVKRGYVNTESIFVDSTHIKASANKRKVDRVIINDTTNKYTQQLNEEINQLRNSEGKSQINFDKTKSSYVSRTDKDCGMFHKGEKERQLAYSNQVACDENGWIVDSKVYPANVNDNKSGVDFIIPLVENREIDTVVMDAGYTSPILLNELFNRGVIPVVPYTRPKGKKLKNGGYKYSKFRYKYNEEENIYVCPAGKELDYRGINSQGYLEYKSRTKDCKKCEFKHLCTNQNHKSIRRHLLEPVKEYAKEIRLSDFGKEMYPKRKFTIERCFAIGKSNHVLGFTLLRGLEKNENRSLVIFAMYNLKKLATINWDIIVDYAKSRLLSINSSFFFGFT